MRWIRGLGPTGQFRGAEALARPIHLVRGELPGHSQPLVRRPNHISSKRGRGQKERKTPKMTEQSQLGAVAGAAGSEAGRSRRRTPAPGASSSAGSSLPGREQLPAQSREHPERSPGCPRAASAPAGRAAGVRG